MVRFFCFARRKLFHTQFFMFHKENTERKRKKKEGIRDTSMKFDNSTSEFFFSFREISRKVSGLEFRKTHNTRDHKNKQSTYPSSWGWNYDTHSWATSERNVRVRRCKSYLRELSDWLKLQLATIWKFWKHKNSQKINTSELADAWNAFNRTFDIIVDWLCCANNSVSRQKRTKSRSTKFQNKFLLLNFTNGYRPFLSQNIHFNFAMKIFFRVITTIVHKCTMT